MQTTCLLTMENLNYTLRFMPDAEAIPKIAKGPCSKHAQIGK